MAISFSPFSDEKTKAQQGSMMSPRSPATKRCSPGFEGAGVKRPGQEWRPGLRTFQRQAEHEPRLQGLPRQKCTQPHLPSPHGTTRQGRKARADPFQGLGSTEIRDKPVCGRKFPRKMLRRNVHVVSAWVGPCLPPQKRCASGRLTPSHTKLGRSASSRTLHKMCPLPGVPRSICVS